MSSQRIITWEEYAKHTISIDCWVLIDGYIYDTTTYLVEHPGGEEILLKYTGFDASKRFKEANHSEYAVSLRDPRRVGKIESNQIPEGHQQRVKNIQNEYLQRRRQKQLQKNLKRSSGGQASNISGANKNFSLAEINKHNKKQDCWVIFQNKVYDVTKYIDDHPGGAHQIMNFAGSDGTKGFEKVGHGQFARKTREKFHIGYVEGYSAQKQQKSSSLNIVMILIILLAIAYGVYTVLL